MSTVRIATIYPIAMRVQRPIYQGDFKFPAVPFGAEPFILEIKDHYEWNDRPFFEGTVNGRLRRRRDVIAADEIANDIIRELTQSHPDAAPGCHPGIWIVRERVPLHDEKGLPILDADAKASFREMSEAEKKAAWAEDLEANRQAQAAWGERAIQKGNIMAQEPKAVPFIPDYCKEMAKYYGQSPKWLNRITEGNTKKCQWCAQIIDRESIICPECGKTVDFKRYAQLEAELKATIDSTPKAPVTPPIKVEKTVHVG